MKIEFVLTLLFLLFVPFFLAVDVAYAQKSTYGASYSYNDQEISYKFSDLDFVNTPSWKPEQGEPPIMLQRALEIARLNLPRFVKNADEFKAKHISLHSLDEDKWYYDISFDCGTRECLKKSSGRYFKIIVKMDGEIIEPKLVELKEKEG